MNKLSLILICLLLFSCEDKKSITFMRCVYHHHELHPEVKKLVDYLFLDKHEKDFASKTADRILKFMSGLNETLEGYQV